MDRTYEYEDDYGADEPWEDDEDSLEEVYLAEPPPSRVFRIKPPEWALVEEEETPWFVFSFPSPGCLVGIIITFTIVLASLLITITGGWKFAPDPAAGQEPGGVAEVLPDVAVEDSATNFTASAEAAAAPCEVSDLFPKKVLRWCNLISYYSNNQNLNPDLVAALVWLESDGNEVAYSRSGAVGLMQVMPKDGLAASFMCINGPCFGDRPTTAELQNPEFNIKYGTRMLSRLLNKHGDLREALKSYGPMNVGYYYADKVLGLFNQYGKTR